MQDVLAVLAQVGLDCSGALFGGMDFPVSLLQADSDPAQARSYFDGATELFPGAEL